MMMTMILSCLVNFHTSKRKSQKITSKNDNDKSFTKLVYKNVVYTPNKSTINLTGIIKSDHPQINNGWIKGWLVDNGKNDTIVVCAHSNALCIY
jgi:hypothetical protein